MSHEIGYSEVRNWGTFEVLDKGEGYEVKRLEISEGKNISYQYHHNREETWTVVGGYGEMCVNGTVFEIGVGDVVENKISDRHSVRATSPLTIIEVWRGNHLSEDDIVRLETNWKKIVA